MPDNVWAQPLVCDLGSGKVMLLVADASGNMSAFDATRAGSPNPLWSQKTPSVGTNCTSDFSPNGNCACPSTGVIDPSTAVWYQACQINSGAWIIYSWNISDGTPFLSPVTVNATDVSGVQFSTNQYGAIERNGLSLFGNNLYLSFASHGDAGYWYSWVIAYDKNTLSQTASYCGTCSSSMYGGGMWGDVTVDPSTGDLFLTTGNASVGSSSSTLTIGTGSQTLNTNGPNPILFIGQSVILYTSSNSMSGVVTSYNQATGALTMDVTSIAGSGTFSFWNLTSPSNLNPGVVHLASSTLSLSDWMTPVNYLSLTESDFDFDTNAVLMNGSFLLVGAKNGQVYTLNESALGYLEGVEGNPPIFQKWPVQSNIHSLFRSNILCIPTDCWTQGSSDPVARFHWLNNITGFDMSGGSASPKALGSIPAGGLGGELVYSSSGSPNSGNGSDILWTVTGTSYTPAAGALLAYEPQGLTLLFNSANLSSDALGNGPKLTNPTVVNGHVYVPTRSSSVVVYGLVGQLAFTPEPPAIVSAGSTLTAVVQIQDSLGNLISSNAPITISSSPSGVGGTLTVNATDGIATFSNLFFTSPGPYTLTASASSAGFSSITSTGITVSQAAPLATSLGGGTIGLKSGPQNARVWPINVANNGPGAAVGAEITNLVLTQTRGATCTPMITSSFPVVAGTIAPSASAVANVTINFTGCAANAFFSVSEKMSANGGAASGSATQLNQLQ